MTALASSNIGNWLKLEALDEAGCFKTTFQVHHLGNVFIRSLHGGVTGATMEMSAEALARSEVGDEARISISSSSIDYLRVTKDSDLFAKAEIVRISRRMAVVDVVCWQDAEDIPIGRGVITLKIDR